MDSSTRKIAIGMTIIFGAIAMFLWKSGPRLITDFWHAGDFVPARSHTITDYTCTTWNGVFFNECTVTFVSPQTREPRQITDWRFGPAPREPVRLLQRSDNASAMTTDLSLRTWWNRMALAMTVLLFGTFLAAALIMKGIRADDPEHTPG